MPPFYKRRRFKCLTDQYLPPYLYFWYFCFVFVTIQIFVEAEIYNEQHTENKRDLQGVFSYSCSYHWKGARVGGLQTSYVFPLKVTIFYNSVIWFHPGGDPGLVPPWSGKEQAVLFTEGCLSLFLFWFTVF